MAFELLRLDILNNKHMFTTPPFSGPPLRGTETDKANTLLISRIATLGLFRHDTIGYTGPLSRHLLAYHQLTAAVRGAQRDLLEMHACNMLLSGAVSRDVPPKQLTDLGASLPFVREPDLGLSLVVKSYLDELSNDAGRRSDIRKWFNHAVDINGDLEKAWKMWSAVSHYSTILIPAAAEASGGAGRLHITSACSVVGSEILQLLFNDSVLTTSNRSTWVSKQQTAAS